MLRDNDKEGEKVNLNNVPVSEQVGYPSVEVLVSAKVAHTLTFADIAGDL